MYKNSGSLLCDMALARAEFSLRQVSVRISFSCACAGWLWSIGLFIWLRVLARLWGDYPPHPPSFADAVRDFTQNTHVLVLAHFLCLLAGKAATLFIVMEVCQK